MLFFLLISLSFLTGLVVGGWWTMGYINRSQE